MPAARPVLSAPQQIAIAIKEWILDGSMRPGDRLPPEPELAEMFGASRPTVRAALQELCANEVLTVRRGRTGGYRVSDISLELLAPRITEYITLSLTVKTIELTQVYEVRRELELLIAELAAERRTAEGLEALEAILAAAESMPPVTSNAAIDLDLRYHQALANCTANPLLIGLEGAMDSAYRQFRERSMEDVTPREALRGLDDLTAAVRARDRSAARTAMERHLSYSDQFFGAGAEPTDEPRLAEATPPA